jgi:glycosyltransferase 2 family protein
MKGAPRALAKPPAPVNGNRIFTSRTLLWSALGGGGAFVLLALLADLGELRRALAAFPLWLLLPVAGLSLLNYTCRFLKWQWFLSRLGAAPPLGESALVTLAGFAFTVTPGKVGEFIKAFMLKKGRGTPYRVTMPVLLLDRFMDFLALFFLSCLGLTFGLISPWLLALPIALMAAALALLRSRTLMAPLLAFLKRFRFARPVGEKLDDLYENGRSLLTLPILLGSLGLSISGWLAEGVGFYLVAKAFGAAFPLLTAVFIYSASTVLGALTMIPGGLVVTEGGLAGLATRLGGMPAAGAVGAVFVCRLMTLWLGVGIGWGAFALSPRLRGMMREKD